MIPIERSITEATYPVFTLPQKWRKRVRFPFTVQNGDPKLLFETSGFWDHESFALMDFFCMRALFHLYEKLPKEYNKAANFEKPVSIEKIDLWRENPVTALFFEFSTESLRDEFPGLAHFSASRLRNLIDRTSKCQLKMEYKVKYFDDSGNKQFYTFSTIEKPDTLFSYSTKDLPYGHRYKVSFNTALGNMFILNILALNIDWMCPEVYMLDAFAQLFYRTLIKHSSARRIELTPKIWKQQMIVLGNYRSKPEMKDIISTSLTHLKKLRLIRGWKYLTPKSPPSFMYYQISK